MTTTSDSTAQRTRVIKHRQLTIRSARQGAHHLLALRGELDIATARALDQELRRVKATDAQQIVLDLSRLEFIDSAGLRVILAARDRGSSDSRLRLRRGPRAVHQVFEITGAARLVTFMV